MVTLRSNHSERAWVRLERRPLQAVLAATAPPSTEAPTPRAPLQLPSRRRPPLGRGGPHFARRGMGGSTALGRPSVPACCYEVPVCAYPRIPCCVQQPNGDARLPAPPGA